MRFSCGWCVNEFDTWDEICDECLGCESCCTCKQEKYVHDLEEMIDKCVSLTDVMREGLSETTLNDVRQRVDERRAGSE